MQQLIPYLTFEGTCEEALNFYSSVLGGKIVYMQRFGEAPMQTGEENKNKVMHSTFSFGDSTFYAADTMPGQPVQQGNSVTLCLGLSDQDQAKKVFDALSEGGRTTMPLEKTFWGALFGMLTDRYGICWMVNCELEQQPGSSNMG